MVLEGGAVSYKRGTSVREKSMGRITELFEAHGICGYRNWYEYRSIYNRECGCGPRVAESRGGDVLTGKVDISLPGKGNSNCHGARPVHQIISMIEWIWTSRLSIQNSLVNSDLSLFQ